MKNFFKTIVVWLLTAILGSTILGSAMYVDNLLWGTRLLPTDYLITRNVIFGGLCCLALSIPTMLVYHLLAVKLYRRRENNFKLRSILGFCAAAGIMLTASVIVLIFGDSRDLDLILGAIPYAIAAFFATLLFRYNATLKPKWHEDSIIFSSNQTSEI